LFQIDKSPGFDLLDSGQRLNVGTRFSAEDDDGRSASALVGRSFRAEPDPDLPARTGLSRALSDWVVAATFNPIRGVNLFTRMRLDSGDLGVNYLEAGADVSTARADGQIRYLQEREDPDGLPVQDLDIHGEIFFLKHWGVSAYAAREFQTGVWREADFGLVYKDECVRIEILYDHNQTTNGVLGPSQGVSFRLSLATLGNSGYAQPRELVPSP
ncbi:MAG: LPS assembly protein LptD, partial [Caulobacteraceae bacterium]